MSAINIGVTSICERNMEIIVDVCTGMYTSVLQGHRTEHDVFICTYRLVNYNSIEFLY